MKIAQQMYPSHTHCYPSSRHKAIVAVWYNWLISNSAGDSQQLRLLKETCLLIKTFKQPNIQAAQTQSRGRKWWNGPAMLLYIAPSLVLKSQLSTYNVIFPKIKWSGLIQKRRNLFQWIKSSYRFRQIKNVHVSTLSEWCDAMWCDSLSFVSQWNLEIWYAFSLVQIDIFNSFKQKSYK